MFPPVNSGGLIEAVAVGWHAANDARFPPVNSGGLIEALFPVGLLNRLYLSFRR